MCIRKQMNNTEDDIYDDLPPLESCTDRDDLTADELWLDNYEDTHESKAHYAKYVWRDEKSYFEFVPATGIFKGYTDSTFCISFWGVVDKRVSNGEEFPKMCGYKGGCTS